MIFNEFDLYRAALKKINLNESALPLYKGRILSENVEAYGKAQKILNCKGLEKCHRWVYDLDFENLDESEVTKLNNLFQLGIDNGFIDDETDTDQEETSQEVVVQDPEPAVEEPVEEEPKTKEAPMAAYTVVYSAMRDGELKTGEAYSNSINTRSAKADVISKLERAGYQNISILAIEAGDPDMCGCDNTFCKQPEVVSFENEEVKEEELTPLRNAFKPFGYNASSANVSAQDEVKMTLTEDEAKEEVKKAFNDVSKEVTKDTVTPENVKKLLDDNKETFDKLKEKLDPKSKDKFEKILAFAEDFANGKLGEYEINEGTGIKVIAVGLGNVLLGVIKFLTWSIKVIGITGLTINWVFKALVKSIDVCFGALEKAGAWSNNKLDKISDSEDTINEEDEEESSDEESSEEDNSTKDEEKSEEPEKDSEEKDSEENEDKKEEDVEEPDEKLKDDSEAKAEDTEDKEDELSAEEKNSLKDSYKKAFKAAMQKCKFFDKCFDDLTLEEKVKFFETMNNAWKNKADPSKFMSAKETEQLEKVVVKK